MTFDDAAGKPDQEFTLGRRSSKHFLSIKKLYLAKDDIDKIVLPWLNEFGRDFYS
jgi:hypothetical protein